LNLKPTEPDQEIRNLRRKVQAGADFFLTQPIFDPAAAQAFLKRYESEHGKLQQPVLVGILPLFSTRHAHFLHHEVPGISIPETMRQRMEKAGEDGVKEGIRITSELVEEIKSWGQGIYLMPQFNRYDVVAEIVEATK
jgi:homocysteine S-methyltransferase